MATTVAVIVAGGRGERLRGPTDIPKQYLPLAGASVLAHSLQSSLYDFYRTQYIRIARKREPEDPDTLEALSRARRAGGGNEAWGRRVMLALYRHYVWRQMALTPTYQPLSHAVETRFRGGQVAQGFADLYAEEQRRMVRWWNYLGSNSHLVVLSISVLARRPEWYLWATAVGFTLYTALITWVQAGTSRSLLRALEASDWREDSTAPMDADLARVR